MEVFNSWFLVRFVKDLNFVDVFLKWQVHRAAWEKQPVPDLVLHRASNCLLDDRLFQSTGSRWKNSQWLCFQPFFFNPRVFWRPWGRKLPGLTVVGRSTGISHTPTVVGLTGLAQVGQYSMSNGHTAYIFNTNLYHISLPQCDLFFLQRDLPELGDQVPEGRNQRLSARGFQNPHNFFCCFKKMVSSQEKKWFHHKKTNGSISIKCKKYFFSGGFHPRAFPRGRQSWQENWQTGWGEA